MMKKISSLFLLAFFLMNLPVLAKDLNAGPWRFEQKTGYVQVPFIIEFEWKGEKLIGTLHNGKEKIDLPDIKFEKDKKRMMIPLQTYQNTLELELTDKNTLSGYHIRHNKDPEIKTQVTGIHGEKQRYPTKKKMAEPLINLNGRWEVTLTEEDDKTSKGIVIFKQKGKTLHGTILTPTGDYRYFEGFVSGDYFEGASFDGSYNYVFRGNLRKKKLTGNILSNSITTVEGKFNAKAKLPDAYKQTQLPSLQFKFPDLTGKEVTLNDPKFAGKAVIVQLFGSWCPNCLDEMNYLIPWYKENSKRGVEIIALSFERSLNKKDALHQLQKLQDKREVPYTLLVAGYTSEDKPMDKIKGLTNFISFPTTIFLNKKHEVIKVHAGFTGPSTGPFYERWKKEFNQLVVEMLK